VPQGGGDFPAHTKRPMLDRRGGTIKKTQTERRLIEEPDGDHPKVTETHRLEGIDEGPPQRIRPWVPATKFRKNKKKNLVYVVRAKRRFRKKDCHGKKKGDLPRHPCRKKSGFVQGKLANS